MSPPTLRALFLCYQSLGDPLVHSQVVAYLEGLAARGHTIHLVTFEPKLDAGRRRELRASMAGRGIAWRGLRYHKRPSLPATIYDTLVGASVATWLVRRHRLDAIHARSHIPAAMALIALRLTGARLIFDVRGLLAEEYVDSGRWRRGGIPYRLTDCVQRVGLRRADAIITLSHRVRGHLFGAYPPQSAVVIPCCADLNGRIAAPEGAAREVRDRLGLGDRPVMIYVGKLTPPYMDRELVEFYAAARALDPRLAFLVVTQAPPETIVAELARAAIPESDYRITSSEPAAIGAYLATADFAVCFCRPLLSLIASSPTKIGEYLAAGLPVVSGPGVGDVDALIAERDVGVVVRSFDAATFRGAAERVRELAADPGARARCRHVGREHFSLEEVGIPRYDALYRAVAAGSWEVRPAGQAEDGSAS